MIKKGNVMKYFIGNWKMFGIPTSYKIVEKIEKYFKKDIKNNKKYKIIISPPFTLLQDFSKRFKNRKIIISAQNSYFKDDFGAHTGNISPYMIKSLGVKYIILGHSENRASGESNQIIKQKVENALKNNFTIILCIGENKIEKKNNKTIFALKKQLKNVLRKNFNTRNLIIAYEPVWSIGTGKLPTKGELIDTTVQIKKTLSQIFKKNIPPVLYGGSVDSNTIYNFKDIGLIDGFLIGGASKSSKKFIDIIKNFYK